MKNAQKGIIILICIFILINIIIFILLLKYKKNNEQDENLLNSINETSNTTETENLINYDEGNDNFSNNTIENDGNIDRKQYFTINACVEKYFNNENIKFIPTNMILIDNSEIKTFKISGILVDSNEYSFIDNFNAIININFMDKIFSLKKIDSYNEEVEKNNKNEKLNQIEFEDIYIDYETIIKDYMELYKGMAIGNPSLLYSKLDQNYKEKRFESEEKFIEYIQQIQDDIKNITLCKYKIDTENSEEIEYIIIDSKEKYYIFKEKNILDYDIFLDTYTVDIPYLTESYMSAGNQKKVEENIEKLFKSINYKDYSYFYNKLNIDFKEKNYKTLNDFINFIKNNFYEEIKVEYIEYSENDNVCIYKLKIYNLKNFEYKFINIFMNLQEETNYEFSFNIE